MNAPASPSSRPLDAFAVAVTIGLCLSWGFNNVAIKLAIHDIPPLIQSAARSVIAAVLVATWTQVRGIRLFRRDGTFRAGLLVGVLFALEFLLIYRGLVWTTVTRGTLFLYLAPFFVVIGSRWLVPGDHFRLSQWLGLLMSFIGIAIAFGLPTPAISPHQAMGDLMLIGAALAWAATTLVIKVSPLNRISAEKTLLYQLVVSAPLLAAGALVFGEHINAMPSPLALGAFAYQTVWVVSVTFAVWFALVVRYSAARLSVFTFLAPLFGVAAGHFVLNEPLTPAFAVAVALVAGGPPPRQPAPVTLYERGLALASRRVPRVIQLKHYRCKDLAMMEFSGPAERHQTVAVKVGKVTVGGGAPVVVQSMTNTDTADVAGTAKQVAALARAGSEIVRITVDRDEAAAAVPHIKEQLLKMNVDVPIVGDFHYIGHKLLADHPGLRRGARQISHQSRQCRLQGKEGPAIRRHRRNRDPPRQAGAHRRQLGLARSGAAHPLDG